MGGSAAGVIRIRNFAHRALCSLPPASGQLLTVTCCVWLFVWCVLCLAVWMCVRCGGAGPQRTRGARTAGGRSRRVTGAFLTPTAACGRCMLYGSCSARSMGACASQAARFRFAWACGPRVEANVCVSFAMDFLVLLPCSLSRCGTPLDTILACGWVGVPSWCLQPSVTMKRQRDELTAPEHQPVTKRTTYRAVAVSGADQQPYRQLKVEDALAYLDKVRSGPRWGCDLRVCSSSSYHHHRSSANSASSRTSTISSWTS